MKDQLDGSTSRAGGRARWPRVHFAWLCTSILLYILLSPWFDTIGSLAAVGLSLILIAAAYSTVEAENLWTPIVLLGASLAATWIDNIFGLPRLAFLAQVLYVGTFIYAVVRVFQFVYRSTTVTFNVLMAGVSVYLLLGLCWMMLYVLLWDLAPGAFAGNLTLSAGASGHAREMLYYSFVTLTTVGYGDISAVSPLARALSILEVLSGVLYLGVLVARLVSMYQHDTDADAG